MPAAGVADKGIGGAGARDGSFDRVRSIPQSPLVPFVTCVAIVLTTPVPL